ncbi:MAG: cation transporter, partial [Acidimicrobiia bacterium]|jgi:cobalt-zinc-cadmium efflux system protein
VDIRHTLDVRSRLLSIQGVTDVHDLHIWTLTSDMEVGSVHLMTPTDVDTHGILDRATTLLRDEFGIAHATLQVEPETHQQCVETSW